MGKSVYQSINADFTLNMFTAIHATRFLGSILVYSVPWESQYSNHYLLYLDKKWFCIPTISHLSSRSCFFLYRPKRTEGPIVWDA